MKRILLAFSFAFLAVMLIACDTTTTTTAAPVAIEFPVDGEFTAYSVTVSSNKPQVTMVTVTIEDGEITGYYLDCRQGTKTNNGTTEAPNYAFAWNTQTKKELGYGYKMHYSKYTATLADINTATLAGYQAWMEAQTGDTIYLEWFQQANLLEAKWLADGVDSAMINKDGDFTNVAGVSVGNSGYTALAKQAVELARLGKFQTFVCSGTDFYMASMIINNLGQVTNLKLDTLQSTRDAAAGTFVWNGYTKQDLGDNYGMTVNGAKYTFAAGAWTASETEKSVLDWYEQANQITDYVMENNLIENGTVGDLQPIADRGVSLNGTSLVDGFAGVTIKTGTYFLLLDQLAAAWAK